MKTELPATGGKYRRNSDGSLTQTDGPGFSPAPEPEADQGGETENPETED